MDLFFFGENSTLKRRRPKGSTVRGGDMFPVDRISNLPESIISHILSLLPTKSAAATSFLSKSWRLRWTKVTAFDFDDELWPDCESEEEMDFPEFVNLVFANHTESIHKLRFRWQSGNVQPAYLNIWLNAAIARNIQDLDLAAVPPDGNTTPEHGDEEYEFRLPAALYTSASLRVLKLQGPFRVKLPHLVCLPKLAFMELIYVKFECDDSVVKLISACPVLHSLKIKRCHYHGDLIVCRISSQFLKSLEIHFDEVCGCSYPLESKLVIDTPALKHLVIRSRVHMEISCIQDVFLVNELDLDVSHIDGGKDGVVKLVQGCCDAVESMILSNDAMVALGIGTADVKMSATFGRLTKLVAEFPRSQWSYLLDLINRCVNLQILDIITWYMFTKAEEVEVNPKSVPQCFSSSLKHVYFRSFDGLEDEMAMLKFILDHGLLIDTVTLFSNDYVPVGDTAKLRILNEVSKLPRVSATCKISFS